MLQTLRIRTRYITMRILPGALEGAVDVGFERLVGFRQIQMSVRLLAHVTE